MAGIMKSKRLRDYSQGALNAALISHRELGMSLYKAAKFNNVPYQTVRRYVKNPDKEKMGHGTKFSDAEEQTIAQILIYFAETNLPLSKAHLEQFILKPALEKGTCTCLLEIKKLKGACRHFYHVRVLYRLA